MPTNAHTISTSLYTRDTYIGTIESKTTTTKMKVLDSGMVVLRRKRSGRGRDGVVVRTKGIPRSRVIELNARMNGITL